jgi:hypothetical protein
MYTYTYRDHVVGLTMILCYVSVAVLFTSNPLIVSRGAVYGDRGEESHISYGNSHATSRSFDPVARHAEPLF